MKFNKKIFLVLFKSVFLMGGIETESPKVSTDTEILRILTEITGKKAFFQISDLVKQSIPQIIASCENYKDIIKLLISTDPKNQLKIFRLANLNTENLETFQKILVDILSKLNLLDRTDLENKEKINNLLLLFSNYDSEILLRALEIRKKSKKPLRQSELQELIKITIQSSNAQLLQYIFQEFTNINSIIFKTNIIEEWLLNPQTDILEIILNQIRSTDQKTQDKILQILGQSIIENNNLEQFKILIKNQKKLLFFVFTVLEKQSTNLYEEAIESLKQADPKDPEIVDFLLSLASIKCDANILDQILHIFKIEYSNLAEELFIQAILNNNVNLATAIKTNFEHLSTTKLKNGLNYLELACNRPKSAEIILFLLENFPELKITKDKTKQLLIAQLMESFSSEQCIFILNNKQKFKRLFDLGTIFLAQTAKQPLEFSGTEKNVKLLILILFFGLRYYLERLNEKYLNEKREHLFHFVLEMIADRLETFIEDLEIQDIMYIVTSSLEKLSPDIVERYLINLNTNGETLMTLITKKWQDSQSHHNIYEILLRLFVNQGFMDIINKPNSQGKTPFIISIEQSILKIQPLEPLLGLSVMSKKINMNITDSEEQLAIEMATVSGIESIINCVTEMMETRIK